MRHYKLQTTNYKLRGYGIALLEILIFFALLSSSFVVLFSAAVLSLRLSDEANHITRASFLLEEGREAVLSLRNEDWDNISSIADGTYQCLRFDSGTPEIVSALCAPGDDDFSRSITFGTPEPDVRNVIVTVSWTSRSGTKSESLAFLVVNIFQDED